MSPLSRRRVLRAAAPVAGLLAAGLLVWQGSYAAFTAQSTNTGNSWAAGTLVLTNNGGGAAYAPLTTPGLFGEVGLRPGSTGTKCLTVEKSGTVVGSDLRFYVPTYTDSTPAFAPWLKLTIDAAPVGVAVNVPSACTGFPVTGLVNVATSVSLDTLPATYAAAPTSATLAAGTQRVAYRFTWTFDPAAPNTLQGKSITATTLGFEVQ